MQNGGGTRELPLAVKAESMWIFDDQGKRYLDANGGAMMVSLGHGRRELAQAVPDKIITCHYAYSTMFITASVEELAAALASHAPPR
ncbi:hypothetical protein DFAR_1860034 [Desulfarculales bacterium]